jgi:uncharacterized protein RhaS with RHS repeats
VIFWHRFYDPSTGRYLSADPIGLDGGINLYAYARGNPVKYIDANGLKARVCCRLVPFIGYLTSARHCYIERDTDGVRTTWGLIGDTGGPLSTTGTVYRNNTFDSGGVCGEWKDDDENQCCPDCVDDCVEGASNAYPSPSKYEFFSGPNSNTFAGTVARTCGLSKPDVALTPGYDSSPAKPAK